MAEGSIAPGEAAQRLAEIACQWWRVLYDEQAWEQTWIDDEYITDAISLLASLTLTREETPPWIAAEF